MAITYENPLLCISGVADEAMANPFRCVAATATGFALAASGIPVGVVQNKPAISETAVVQVAGVSRAEAASAISVNTRVACTTGGKIKTAATTDTVLGIALAAASGDGHVIPVLLTIGGAPLP
jgi:hypothetical protein